MVFSNTRPFANVKGSFLYNGYQTKKEIFILPKIRVSRIAHNL